MRGIEGYGVLIPQNRISVEEIYSEWCFLLPPNSIRALSGATERAVNNWDEDPVTMGGEAAMAAIEMAGVSPKNIEALYFGSFTNPYVTKSSGAVVAEIVGMGPEIMCADCQFGGKSGTAAIQICLGLIGSGMIRKGLAIGSDSFSRHIAPNTFMEYLASAGAAAFILGDEKVVAEIEGTFSYTTDTADFFRVDGDRYLRRGVSEEEQDIGYNEHITNAARGFFKKFQKTAQDYQYAVFNQNTGRLPFVVGKELGFQQEAIKQGMLADRIGDCGSASPLISLAHVLDMSKPGDRIFVASYGYGASSDILSIRVTDLIEEARRRRKDHPSIAAQIDDKIDIDYKTYLRLERKIIQEYI